jgi:probable F420-dependent oxidoreductase
MQFGLTVPNFGEFSDIRATADLATQAEAAGWDGFFVWDHMAYGQSPPRPTADPWIMLAAIAMQTERVRLGPLVTPLPRRRPQKLARETVSLDHLSGGRVILGVGLGFPPINEYANFGEDPEAQVRAQKLDEGLEVLTRLWSGKLVNHAGRHYTVHKTRFLPKPVQQPRIPIWVGGYWNHSRAPFRRAARWDGVCPGGFKKTPGEVRAMLAYIREHRANPDDPFDFVFFADPPKGTAAQVRATLAEWAAAGVTWWVSGITARPGALEAIRRVVKKGPPRGPNP